MMFDEWLGLIWLVTIAWMAYVIIMDRQWKEH